jgi:hypothetical protein
MPLAFINAQRGVGDEIGDFLQQRRRKEGIDAAAEDERRDAQRREEWARIERKIGAQGGDEIMAVPGGDTNTLPPICMTWRMTRWLRWPVKRPAPSSVSISAPRPLSARVINSSAKRRISCSTRT